MIHWESQLERDAVFLFEFSPGVTAYREQPFTTYYALDGKTRRYTPDFELTLSTGELLVIEVKPAAKLKDPDMAKRFARIRDHFASNDRPYRILTDTEIRQSALLENLKIILRHRRAALTSFERRRTVELLPNATTFSFATAARLLGSDGVVWGLICEGLLRCDLTQLVNDGTVLHIAREGASHDQLLF